MRFVMIGFTFYLVLLTFEFVVIDCLLVFTFDFHFPGCFVAFIVGVVPLMCLFCFAPRSLLVCFRCFVGFIVLLVDCLVWVGIVLYGFITQFCSVCVFVFIICFICLKILDHCIVRLCVLVWMYCWCLCLWWYFTAGWLLVILLLFVGLITSWVSPHCRVVCDYLLCLAVCVLIVFVFCIWIFVSLLELLSAWLACFVCFVVLRCCYCWYLIDFD